MQQWAHPLLYAPREPGRPSHSSPSPILAGNERDLLVVIRTKLWSWQYETKRPITTSFPPHIPGEDTPDDTSRNAVEDLHNTCRPVGQIPIPLQHTCKGIVHTKLTKHVTEDNPTASKPWGTWDESQWVFNHLSVLDHSNGWAPHSESSGSASSMEYISV